MLPDAEKFENTFTRLVSMQYTNVTDGQTDLQIPHDGIARCTNSLLNVRSVEHNCHIDTSLPATGGAASQTGGLCAYIDWCVWGSGHFLLDILSPDILPMFSASDSFTIMALYKFTYLLTYLLRKFLPPNDFPSLSTWRRT